MIIRLFWNKSHMGDYMIGDDDATPRVVTLVSQTGKKTAYTRNIGLTVNQSNYRELCLIYTYCEDQLEIYEKDKIESESSRILNEK